MSEVEADAPGMSGPGTAIQAFTFGDAESIMARDTWQFFEGIYRNGDWYEPPVPMAGLARAYRMSPHHQSAIKFKVNQLTRHFVASRWLDAEQHQRLVLDFLQMGNGYLEAELNMAGRPLRFRHAPALHMRVGVEPGKFFWVRFGDIGLDGRGSTSPFGAHEFREGSIVHVAEPDVEQEVYGLPEWLSALQSGLLNENATLFRRRYYLNGAHAGFVFYLNEPTMDAKDAAAIRDMLSKAKGVGNFKNLFIHAPNGKKDGVQILPIAEVAAKDEFLGIKDATRDDMLAVHRVPPVLLGVMPKNAGGFGDIRSAADVFFTNEIEPIMAAIARVNEITGLPVVNYKSYVPMMPVGDSAAGNSPPR